MSSPRETRLKAISGLYAIIDSTYIRLTDAGKTAEDMAGSGVKVIQLRAKGMGAKETLDAARAIREKARRRGALFIVNDRVDVALLSEADGVHLGQDDLPVEAARKLLGPSAIVGLSTHNVEEALEAQRRGADYISFGPIFKTRTKGDADAPKGIDGLRRLASRGVTIPIVAIGGITGETAKEVIDAGASAAAIISDILLTSDINRKAKAIIADIT
jgi:thiamine-phosphate diphosphorylase